MPAAPFEIKFPAVITTFDLLAVKVAKTQRHAAMRAVIIQGEDLPLPISAKNQRLVEQPRSLHLAAFELRASHGGVPKAAQRLALGK